MKPNNVIVIDDDEEEVGVSNMITKSQVTQSTRSHPTREFESFDWQQDHRKSHELSSFLEEQLRKSQEKMRTGSQCLLIDDDDEVGVGRLNFDDEENSFGFDRKNRRNNFMEEKRSKTKENEEESLEQNLTKCRKESSEGEKAKNGILGRDWSGNGKIEKVDTHEKPGESYKKFESYRKLWGEEGREKKESDGFFKVTGEAIKNSNRVEGFNSVRRSSEDFKEEVKLKVSDTGKISGHKLFEEEGGIETDSRNGKVSKKELIYKPERKKSKDENEKQKESESFDSFLKTPTSKETANNEPPPKEVKMTTHELLLKEYSSRVVDPSSLKLFNEIGLNATLKKIDGLDKKPENSEKDKGRHDKNGKNPDREENKDKKPTLNAKNLKKHKETKERSKSPKERQHTHTHNLRRKPRKRSKSIANSIKSKEKSKNSNVTDWKKYQQSNYDFSTSVRSKKIAKDSKTNYYRHKYMSRKNESHSSKVSQHHHHHAKSISPECSSSKPFERFHSHSQEKQKWGLDGLFKDNKQRKHGHSHNKESSPKQRNDKDLSRLSKERIVEKLDRELDMMREESPNERVIKEKESKTKEIEKKHASHEGKQSRDSGHSAEKKPFNQPEIKPMLFSPENNINPPPTFSMPCKPPIQEISLPDQSQPCPKPFEQVVESVSQPQKPSDQQELMQESSSQDTAKLFSPPEENSQPSFIIENKPAPPSEELIKSFLQEIHDMRGTELAKELRIEPLGIGNLRRDRIKDFKALLVRGKDRKDWFGQVGWHVRKNKDHMGTAIIPFEKILKAGPKETAWFLAKLFKREIRDNLM